MPKINVKIDILDILTKRKEALRLNEIKKNLRLNIQARTLLRELNNLIENNRIVKDGHTNK